MLQDNQVPLDHEDHEEKPVYQVQPDHRGRRDQEVSLELMEAQGLLVSEVHKGQAVLPVPLVQQDHQEKQEHRVSQGPEVSQEHRVHQATTDGQDLKDHAVKQVLQVHQVHLDQLVRLDQQDLQDLGVNRDNKVNEEKLAYLVNQARQVHVESQERQERKERPADQDQLVRSFDHSCYNQKTDVVHICINSIQLQNPETMVLNTPPFVTEGNRV